MSSRVAADAEVRLHVVSKADAVEKNGLAPWDDPDAIAVLSPGKLRVIRTNPLSAGPDDPARIIGTYANQVVGCLDILPGRLIVAEEEVSCLWASGLFVSPRFRQLGMGAMLLLRFQELHHTVAACSVTEEAYPLYQKLHWLDFPLRRYISVRRSRAVLERYAPGRASAAAGTLLVDSTLAAHRALAASARTLRLRGLSREEVDRLPTELDDLMARPDKPAAFHRSAAWVNWVLDNSFESHPQDRRGLFLVRDRRGRCVAYFLITSRFYERASRRELRNLLLGSLQDWMILDKSAIDVEQLVLLAVRELSSWGVAAVEVCLGEDDLIPRLWRWGVRRVEDLHLLVKANAGSPLRDERFASPAAWRLRPADGDYAFF